MTVVAADPAPVCRWATSWAREPDISARSTLVTILGDTVAPLGGTVWMSDLIALAEPFGFSQRLVRTSLFRLASEGWVDNERVGRRSRYSLTDHGRRETEAAERRIYRLPNEVWDGMWTLVFLPPGLDEPITHPLRWRGFARMTDQVLARPGDHTDDTRQLLDHLDLEPTLPVAAARFDDGAPVTGEAFRRDSGLVEAEEAYHRFIDRYRPGGGPDPDPDPGPLEAFALRTMVVHDLRRARLRDPDLPSALLPDGWVGDRAMDLAASTYRAITDQAWQWVGEITGLTADPSSPTLSERFAHLPKETDTP